MNQIIRAGTGERAQFLVHPHNDNTIRFLLRYPGRIDESILSRAVRAVVMSVDVLHSSFFYDGADAHWRVCDPEEGDYFRVIRGGDPRLFLLEPVALNARAQLQVTLVTEGTGCALVVRISHLCADGSDAKYLLGKLARAYDLLLTTGSTRGLFIKNGSREPRQVYSSLRLPQKLSLLRLPVTGIRSRFPYPTPEPGRPGILFRVIPAQTMEAARERARRENATVNDLLLTACYRSFAALAGAKGPLAVAAMMDVRRHCVGGDTEGLCNLSGSLPTALRQGVRGDFPHTLSQIAAQTRRIKSAPLAGLAGFPLLYGAARHIPLPILSRFVGCAYSSMNLSLTNLGTLSPASLTLGGMAPTCAIAGGPVKKKPGVQVCAASFSGSCTLTILGEFTGQDRPLLQRLLDEMASQLQTYANQEPPDKL